MSSAPGRRFRLRLRPGRAVIRSSRDVGEPEAMPDAGSDEIIVTEKEAAFLIRQKAVDIIEVLDAPPGHTKPGQPS